MIWWIVLNIMSLAAIAMNELVSLTSVGVLCYASFKLGRVYLIWQLRSIGVTLDKIKEISLEYRKERGIK